MLRSACLLVHDVQIVIRSDQRVCFFGRTGSGKTTLAVRILQASGARWAILDAKHGVSVPGVPVVSTYASRLPQQIIRIPEAAETYAAIYWDYQVRRILRARKPAIIYIDELTLVNPSTRVLSRSIGRAIRTGRSQQIAVWCGSQRPTDIPSAVFTESEHFFVFQLTYARDREKVASFTGDAALPAIEGLRGHDFVYYNVLDNRLLIVKQ
jgi:ABC-type dipeptide/oligopeptide/nickel transport system ATPase component